MSLLHVSHPRSGAVGEVSLRLLRHPPFLALGDQKSYLARPSIPQSSSLFPTPISFPLPLPRLSTQKVGVFFIGSPTCSRMSRTSSPVSWPSPLSPLSPSAERRMVAKFGHEKAQCGHALLVRTIPAGSPFVCVRDVHTTAALDVPTLSSRSPPINSARQTAHSRS